MLVRAGVTLDDVHQHSREHEDLYQLAELRVSWDERIWVWRFRHYGTVVRALGEGSLGTQGTPVEVLGKLIAQRQLPKLWEVRHRLVEEFDARPAGDQAG